MGEIFSSNLPQPHRKGLRRVIAASLALHAVAVAVVLHTHVAPMLVARPGSSAGHRELLTYMQGGAVSHVAAQSRSQAVTKTPMVPSLARSFKPSTAAAPVTPAAAAGNQEGATTDSQGSGEITLALMVQHPYPKPDLDKLPHGTHGDVVVDVTIDEQGHIAKSNLVRGLGASVDQTVLATIQQWTFTPATKDGHPVASEQELLFHYEHA